MVVTGDEVLRGRIGDENGRFLAGELDGRGFSVLEVRIVGDDHAAIAGHLRRLLDEGVELICTSGGLGGTHDDVTMAAVATAVGASVAVRDDALVQVRRAYGAWRVHDRVSEGVLDQIMRKQASLPDGAVMIPPAGSAPGCMVTFGPSLIVVLPGPPRELAPMWADARSLEPLRTRIAGAQPAAERLLRIYRAVEGEFADVLADLPPEDLRDVTVGVCARVGEIEVTIRTAAGQPQRLRPLESALRARFGDAVYSDGPDVGALVAEALRARGQTVAVAESCTGGGLGAALTRDPGASDIFAGGVIAYSDAVKREALVVPVAALARHGAVSAQVAEAMAAGARRATGADWALSITGIAGPGGATPTKPVGLVHVGIAGPDLLASEEFHLPGDRERVRERAVAHALHRLRIALRDDA